MAIYPEWVMKHKAKGTYINHVKGKYYLYAAHSERVPGTNKVKRVSDGYIGRITEEDGLIPAKDKVTGGVEVYEYGLCMAMRALLRQPVKGLKREFRGAADKVLVSAILTAAYGGCGNDEYCWSYLSLIYPGTGIGNLTDKQQAGADRISRQATDLILRQFGGGAGAAAARLSRVCAVSVNGRIYMPSNIGNTKEWLKSHGVEWDDWYGEDKTRENTGDIFGDQGLRTYVRHRPPAKRGRPKKACAQTAQVFPNGQ